MGSVCSSTEILHRGSFYMPGVPSRVAVETFCDIEASPSFIPLILSIEMVRGEPGQVGACWMERRQVRNFQVLVRRTITKNSVKPFRLSALIELIETKNSWTTPDFVGTYTIDIEPSSIADEYPSCSIRWTDALISRGMLGRFLSVFCVPCLKRQWVVQRETEWLYYYEEALRRTLKAVPAIEDANAETVKTQ